MKNLALLVALGLGTVGACGDDGKPKGAGAGAGAPGEGGDGAATANAGGDQGGSGASVSEAGQGGSGVSVAEAGQGGNGASVSEAGQGGSGADTPGGQGGAGGAPAALSGPVHGKVLAGGEPLAGAVVVIDGVTTSSDASGDFTVADVDSEYDLIVVVVDPTKLVQLEDGVHTREPRINFGSYPTLATRSASVAGKLSGGAGFPLDAGHKAAVTFTSDGTGAFAAQTLETGADFYELNQANFTALAWSGPSQDAGQLFALQWVEDASGPTAYSGMLRTPFTLQDGQAHGNVNGSVPATNLAVVNPAESSVAGTLTLPAGSTGSQAQLWIEGVSIPVTLPEGDFSVVVPDGQIKTGLSVGSSASTGSSFSFTLRPASGAWAVAPPAPPNLLLPIDNAQGITHSTQFSWSAPPQSAMIYVTWQIGGWTIYRVTSDAHATLPDLSAYGIVLSPGASGTWHVNFEGPASSVDDDIFLEDQAFSRDVPYPGYFGGSASDYHFKLAN